MHTVKLLKEIICASLSSSSLSEECSQAITDEERVKLFKLSKHHDVAHIVGEYLENNKLLKGDTIEIFNYGNCKRDFTYVDDIVEGVKRVMQHAPEKKTGEDGLPLPPYAVYNIGNNSPENLLDFVTILQQELIRAKVLPEDYDFEAHKKLVPMQPGDVPITYADTSALEKDFGFKPSTPLREGLRKFAEWYHSFYQSEQAKT